MGECAMRLGVAVDRIRRPIKDMAEEGLLIADPLPIARGTRFRLRQDLVERAEEEARSGQREGAIVPHQPVLFAHVPRLLDLADALRNSELTRSVVWVGRMSAGNSYVLVLDGQSTSSIAADRLRAAVEAAGGTCVSGRAEEIMGPEEWRQRLAAVRDAAL